ncbi:MAG: hypothetical protein GY940_14575 [bacterium]|nr:hypothetical protein [bacterium]
MKTKTFGKKLILNKATVSHLNESDLNKAKGGVTTTCSYDPGCSLACATPSCTWDGCTTTCFMCI